MYCNSKTYVSPYDFDAKTRMALFVKSDKKKIKDYCYITVITNVTTNQSNVYVGRHSTDNLNDGYYGSGSFVKKAAKANDEKEQYWFETLFYEVKHVKEFEELLIDQAVEKYGSICVNKINRKIKEVKPVVEVPVMSELETIKARSRIKAETYSKICPCCFYPMYKCYC